jgi:hypothetical protein
MAESYAVALPGQKSSSAMSALPSKADMARRRGDVCQVSLAAATVVALVSGLPPKAAAPISDFRGS